MSNTTVCTTACPKRLNATIETNSINLILCSNNNSSPFLVELDAEKTVSSLVAPPYGSVVRFSKLSIPVHPKHHDSNYGTTVTAKRPTKRCRLLNPSRDTVGTTTVANGIQTGPTDFSKTKTIDRRPTPQIPAPLLGSLLAPFLPDRQTFNNFIISCHEIYRSCRHIPAPWPCKQVACDGVVQAVTFSPSGELLAYTSDETVITLLNRQTGERTKLQAGSKITSLAFAPNGQFLASGQRPLDNEPLSNDNIAVCVWDLRTACIKTHDITMGKNCQELYRYGGAHSVSFSPDGKILASGGMDQTVHLWERSYSTDGETVATRFQYQRALTGLSNWIYTVKFSPNGKYLAAVGEGETSVWLWSIEQDYDVVVLQDEGTCHKETIHCIDFSANGKYLVSGSDDETIRVWDLKSLSCHKVLEGNCCPVWTLACSPWKTHHSDDNTLIVSGGKDQDTGERVLRLWSLETGKTDRILRGYLGYVTSVAFSPSGITIASGSFDHQLMTHRVR